MASVDFLHHPPQPRLGWLLLAAGTVALVTALLVDRRATELSASADQVLQAQAELQHRRQETIKVVAPTASDIRLRQAEFESRAPWLALLRTIETTSQDPVYLRSFTLEPAAATIKLEAEAPTFAEALAYAGALDESSLLHPALLTSHDEVPDAATGKNVVHFSVMTRWNSR